MTPEEAIKAMHNLNLVLSITENERAAVNAAIAALEKQIEKAPNIITMQGMEFPHCQRCGRVVFSDKYCGDCGQKVKKAVE